ncbi:hypothetical protein L2744_19265 [Shewanella profunda]|uniref:hypothetical protein n=1 Tax=Shewanella profunda TaxID=254793 RepID=UPI002010355C|nr:hypothetical protein [Shewanella profunda]MCL1091701.1 hypothetical protein [Shewanella profunda]
MKPLTKPFRKKVQNTYAEKPSLVLRFNQLLIFHSLLLLAVSLLTRAWLGQLKLVDIPLAWGFILIIPIAVSLSLLLRHQVTRHSLSSLFSVWMLLWIWG